MVSHALITSLHKQSEIIHLNQTQDSETFKFLKEIYQSPPKINIRITQLESIKANRLNLPKFGQNSVVIPKRHTYPLAGKINAYKKNNYSQAFYKGEQTLALRTALQRVPVYVVVNSNQEIVLAQPYASLQTTPKNPKYNDLREQKIISTSNEGKLGLFFLNKTDAENYLKDIMATRNPEGSGIGLILHCIDLNSAYEIMRQSHPNIGFKLVPNLTELTNLLTKKINNPNLIFDELQYQTYYKIRPVPAPYKLGYLPCFSFVQNNEYFKGVPLYIIQYKHPAQKFSEKVLAYAYVKYFRPFIYLGYLTDEIYGRLINTRDFLIGCGQRSIMRGKIETAQVSDRITNYAFFSIDQALHFLEECENLHKENKHLRKDPSTGIVSYLGSRANTNLSALVMRPRIFVTNLEDFLERWEEATMFKHSIINSDPDDNITLFDVKETIFVPKLEPNIDFLRPTSKMENVKQNFISKCQKLKAITRIFTEA